MSITLKLDGLTEVKDRLRILPDTVQKKILRVATRDGARLMRSAIARAAPVADRPHYRGKAKVAPGTLRRAVFAVWARELLDKGEAGHVVSLRRGKKYARTGKTGGSRDAFYWTWVEKGHRIVRRSSKAAVRTTLTARRKAARIGGDRVPAHPFFNPTYRATRARVESVVSERIRKQIGLYLP